MEVREVNISVKKINEMIKGENYRKNIDELKELIEEDYNNVYKTLDGNIMVGNLLTLLILLKPFHEFEEEFTSEFAINLDDVNSWSLYFDKIIYHFIYTDPEKVDDLRKLLYEMVSELTEFASANVLLQSGTSVSLYEMNDIISRVPEVRRNLFYDKDDIGDEFNFEKIIDMYKNNNKELIEHIKSDPEYNSYRTLINSGAGINVNQFGEVFSMVGFKSNMFGDVIPSLMDTSYARGLKKPSDFYIDATDARRAIVTVKDQVRKSGYTTRKMVILTIDSKLDNNVEDCGSKHYLTQYMKDETTLNRYMDRYYIDSNGNEQYIDPRKDNSNLIGKHLRLRSPVTCALDHGRVCKKCYGKFLSVINRKAKGIGTIAALNLTEPMTQKLLSTKHIQMTVIENFKWDPKFSNYMHIDGYNIIPKDKDLKIAIHNDDIVMDEFKDSHRYSTQKFIIIDEDNGKEYEIKSPTRLHVPDKNIKNMNKMFNEKKDRYEYKTSDLNAGHLFDIIVKSKGIVDPLLELKNMLEYNSILDTYEGNYHALIQRAVELCIESGVNLPSVHLEVIFRELIFLNGGMKDRIKYKDPNFNPNIEVIEVTDAILKSEDPTKGIVFERISEQLDTDSKNDLFTKAGKSEFNKFFDIDLLEGTSELTDEAKEYINAEIYHNALKAISESGQMK